MIVDTGIQLIKLYFSVSRKEQLRRFEKRAKDPLKHWKVSPIDMLSKDKWEEYTEAKEAMFKLTHMDVAPWTIIKSDDKMRARINAMRHVLHVIDYDGKDESVAYAPRSVACGLRPRGLHGRRTRQRYRAGLTGKDSSGIHTRSFGQSALGKALVCGIDFERIWRYRMHRTISVFLLGVAAVIAFAACGGGETTEVIREVPVEVIVEKEVVREVEVEVPVEKEVIKEVTKTEVVEVIATREPEPTTMRAANLGPVEFLDSAKSQSVNDTFNALMHAGVTTRDVTYTNSLPELAHAWDVNEDVTQFTFHLRDDTTWHNGNGIVADDIVWNWDRIRNDVAERGRGKAHLAVVTDWSAPDDYTFEVNLEFTTPIFMSERITNLPYMSDPAAISTIDVAPVYAGAYRFREAGAR